MTLRTCVAPDGRFVYGVHRPHFRAENLRETESIESLGALVSGAPVLNTVNFPSGAVAENGAATVFEVPNPFPFRGTTYILKQWADRAAGAPADICLPKPFPTSFHDTIRTWPWAEDLTGQRLDEIFDTLPNTLQLALAATSTDAEDLVRLATACCDFLFDAEGAPVGLRYAPGPDGRIRPVVQHETLFDILSNNPHLPDAFKRAMVLRPGVQGESEIVGEWCDPESNSHVFEYLRRNSYIPWGHYAANMADDSIRYRIEDLTDADICGMRHLYYQRTYIQMAAALDLPVPASRRPMTLNELEDLRKRLREALAEGAGHPFAATLWGWNFGFDYAPSGYRLHASHQQIHQQYALVPDAVPTPEPAPDAVSAFWCGDLVGDFIRRYRRETGRAFFPAYLEAIGDNRRMDGDERRPRRLVVFEDDRVMALVPKAQTSQWELHVMVKTPCGNILEADAAMRRSLDRALFVAVKILGRMGARMITAIEYPKRFDSSDSDQHLLYALLPRLPESPGAFSEAQMRWINGHYPEDFAAACRKHLPDVDHEHPLDQ